MMRLISITVIGLSASLAGCGAPGAPPAPGQSIRPAVEARPVARKAPLARAARQATPFSALVRRPFHRLMRPEQAPPLQDPRRVRPGHARGLEDNHRVVGLWIGEASRAYPVNLLAYHRVANDRLAGRQIIVAHGPLTGAVLCAATPDRYYSSGVVHEGDDLLADATTGDLWSVMEGRSIFGLRAGKTLERINCVVMTWGRWKRLRRRTTVAWPRPVLPGFDYTRDPWAWYRKDDRHMVAPLHYVDLRLPHKQPVVGVGRGRRSSAFVLPGRGRHAINTAVDGREVVVVLDGGAGFGGAFHRRVSGHGALTFDVRGSLLVDRETGSQWNLLGQAVAGPLRGRALELEAGAPVHFFAWAAFNQGTSIQKTDLNERSSDTRRSDNG